MTALLAELQAIIAAEGPITVERYMALCLGHPVHGYYMTRDPFGAQGDFTTAPEISQMFGELIGVFAAATWDLMGRPAPLRLVELGPGRATLIADLLRAGRAAQGFLDALILDLVETSPVLRARQQERLAGAAVPVTWHERLREVPAGPAIIIANEFLDALPVRQFVDTNRGWCERRVGLADDGRLIFGLAPGRPPVAPPAAPLGTVLEWPAAALELCAAIADRVAHGGGAALIIDYGYGGPAFGDTLQAVQRHAFVDPLAEPGAADLTVHVDFARLATAARARGAAVHGPIAQGSLLRALGIGARAAALRARAAEPQARDLDAALQRLTGEGPGDMGRLFKAIAVTHPELAALPGFTAL